MFCPNCGNEYQDGVYQCPDCKVVLIKKPIRTANRKNDYLVTVLKTNDVSQLMLAKALLLGAHIPFFAKDEIVQDIFGVGRIGSGFNVITGPIQIQVTRDRAEEARSLLSTLEDNSTDSS